MLEVTALTREFATGDSVVTAVDGVSLTVPDGAFAAIVGPSGSGKSTLLSLLGTLDRPTDGSIVIGGTDITMLGESELTAYRRSRIGFVFQSYNLIPNLSALQNVMLPMEFAGVSRHDRYARATELLDQVGLAADKQRRKPGHLSGGEQQRVAVARAMANRPCLILADEPTGNLDSETGKRIVDLLRQLARIENTTIVAVTHDTDIAAEADVTFNLRDGRLVEVGVFLKAAEAANAAYDAWLEDRDDKKLQPLVRALSEMIATAPAGRRLSPTKIRSRYREAEGSPAFESVVGKLEVDDLLEAE
jgi:putative ABC transport system ATP-binding protein